MLEPLKAYEVTGIMISELMARGYSFEELQPKGFWEKFTPFQHMMRINRLYSKAFIEDVNKLIDEKIEKARQGGPR